MQCESILVPSATRRAQRMFSLSKCPGNHSNSVRPRVIISEPIDLLRPEQEPVVRAGLELESGRVNRLVLADDLIHGTVLPLGMRCLRDVLG
jgi:hypothetical protein